jgi:DNA primase
MDKIATLTKHVKEIVSFYDSDEAGQKANKRLAEELNRPIRTVKFPEIDGKSKLDVNELLKIGYGYDDFEAMINEASVADTNKPIGKEEGIIEKEDGYYVAKVIKDERVEVQITNFHMKVSTFLISEAKKEVMVNI